MSWRSPHGTPLPSWRERTLLMGILNLTPDSFSDGGQLATPEDALRQAEALIAAGADVLDLGAESTRPGSHPVEARAELDRLLPTLRLLRRRLPKTPLSIDTYKADVAAAALAEGADLINDVEGGRNNPEIWDICAKYNAPYIVMHSRGEAHNLHDATSYHNVTVEVLQELSELIVKIRNAGVKDIIVDPGFGFSKSLEENHELMTNLRFFQLFETPILCGISRKSMIYKKLNKNPETAINGTTALNTYALLNGATFLRVHDPEEASEIIRLLNTE